MKYKTYQLIILIDENLIFFFQKNFTECLSLINLEFNRNCCNKSKLKIFKY